MLWLLYCIYACFAVLVHDECSFCVMQDLGVFVLCGQGPALCKASFTLRSITAYIFGCWVVHSKKCSDPIRFRCQKVLLRAYFRNVLNQYRSSIRTVSDQYTHICIRPVWIACLRAVFAELIQSCRTDTDPIYSSVSDPLPKSSVVFLGTLSHRYLWLVQDDHIVAVSCEVEVPFLLGVFSVSRLPIVVLLLIILINSQMSYCLC